jgi:hypothetical protein
MSRVRAVVHGVALLFAAGVAPVAAAAAQRTFVAHFGVDNPTCSIALPCRGFAAAVSATSANGEVIVLDSAGYGAVVITKSVSIIAPPGVYAGVSVASGTGITVNAAPADKVVLRGLSVNGQGGSDGIAFVQGAELNIDGCEIANMGANGIVVSAANGNATIRNTISRDNAANGISILGGSARVVLDNVQLTNNGGSGLYAMNAATAIISASIIAGNAVGLQGDGPAISITTVVASHNKISRNGIGIKAGAIMGLVYALADNNLLSANSTAVSIGSNSTGITFGNNVYANNGADGSMSLSQSTK